MTGAGRTLAVAFVAAAILSPGCGTTEISSRWRASDSQGNRLRAASTPPASTFGDTRVSGTVENDSEFVYVALRTTNREIQRIVAREGCTLWFDRDGGAKKTFGIHYPIPVNGGGYPGQGDPGEGITQEREREEQLKLPAELDLYAGPEEHQRMSILATGGIAARMYRLRDTLVVELKVPLASGATHPFGIGLTPGGAFGLGVILPAVRRDGNLPIDRQERDGEPESGFGGRRGGDMRGRGAPRPDEGAGSNLIDAWAKVHLSPGR